VTPHGAGRTTRRVYEDRIDAGGPQRRRLKIGGNAANFHSRAPGRVGKSTNALAACVTGENPRSAGFERNGFASGCGARVVDELTTRNGGETTNESVGRILDNERAFPETGKGLGPRAGGLGSADLKASTVLRLAHFNTGVVKLLHEFIAVRPGRLHCENWLCVVPFNQSLSLVCAES